MLKGLVGQLQPPGYGLLFWSRSESVPGSQVYYVTFFVFHDKILFYNAGEYIRAFRQTPLDPLVSLCLGLQYLHLASQRFPRHRHTCVIQVKKKNNDDDDDGDDDDHYDDDNNDDDNDDEEDDDDDSDDDDELMMMMAAMIILMTTVTRTITTMMTINTTMTTTITITMIMMILIVNDVDDDDEHICLASSFQ